MPKEGSQQPVAGFSGDQIAGDWVGGDKVAGDKFEGDKITVVVGSPEQAGAFVSSLRWSWPKAIDDPHYRSEKRQGFVGRDWLRKELQVWARQEQGEQALVIVADYGVGKTAFLAEVIDTAAAGRPVVAHHFCRADIPETLQPGAFVRSLASQLAQALPAYRALIEADDAKELRDKLDQATEQSSNSAEKAFDKAVLAFDQAVLAPLRRIDPPAEPLLLLVDALDEAQEPLALSGANVVPSTIVSLLARHATYLLCRRSWHGTSSGCASGVAKSSWRSSLRATTS